MSRFALIVAAACSSPSARPSAKPAPLVDDQLQLLVTPAADHAPFVRAIDGAKASVDLAMFHLTDVTVVDALMRAAARGATVRVILDGRSLQDKKYAIQANALRAGGASVRPSSAAFSITHEKAMVIDKTIAFVTAINLTRDAASTRDFGVITRAPGVIADVEALFDADWANAAGSAGVTPAQREPSLVVSPTSSRAKLVGLIASAQRDVIATVENLGDPSIANALIDDAKRGVRVRLIVPLCDKNPDPLYNLVPARRLAGAGVLVRMMPAPADGYDAAHPYMHSKMIQIDAATTYVGSENFSINSLAKARELGLVFANSTAAQTIGSAFEADWTAAAPPPADGIQPDCPGGE
ncbi:MAG TPA: phosphatidylserine/phosphatidylglycerophosphate/cardiolipin synthase family protein [Kofleriaceae bacterium]|nr:phosphatidylserine/phosphatidylglycerophosphate/cardiolipin synthase family protein [Kofleriaceae bacterium]